MNTASKAYPLDAPASRRVEAPLLERIRECRGTLIDANSRAQAVDWMVEADGLLREAARELERRSRETGT